MPTTEPSFWRVHCHIGHHPGQWQYWFRDQLCAVGYPPPEYVLHGPSRDVSWSTARNALLKMRVGDCVVASLPGFRVGRLGRIFEMKVEDRDWDPVVPPNEKLVHGENGRRILVRWELGTGPADASKVVLLPENRRFSSGEARATIRQIPLPKLKPLRDAMIDDRNWVSLIGNFALETALSDYIALHPELLEQGLISHPGFNVREHRLESGERIDALLQDRDKTPVVVECKQDGPLREHIDQVVKYRRQIAKNPALARTGKVRAMLVHGGASRVAGTIAEYARKLDVELVYHELRVNFTSSGS